MTLPESGSDEIIDGEVGRGYFWVTGGKLWFLVTATVLNIGLPRLLGDPALFGAYKVIAGFLAVVSMVVLNGALLTASKATSEASDRARSVCGRLHRIAGLISLGLALMIFLFADSIAGRLWSDSSLAPPLRVASGVVFSYGLYATWIGVANGLKAFRTQALFDIAFATLKTTAIIGAVIMGAGVVGIFAAFSSVALVMMCVAFLIIVLPLKDKRDDGDRYSFMSPRRILQYMTGIMGAYFALNVLLQGDLVLLKGLVHEAVRGTISDGYDGWGLALAQGWIPGGAKLHADFLAADLSSALAGIYAGARTITMIPFQGIIPLTFVIFPVLSAATFRGDQEQCARLAKGAIRFAILLVCVLCGGLVLTESLLVSLLFGPIYGAGKVFLVPMVAGTLSIALYVVLTSMLTAAGYPGRVLAVGLVAAAIHLGLMVVSAGVDGLPFERAVHIAWASALGPLLGVAAATIILRSKLSVVFPWLSLARAVATTILVTWLVGNWVQLTGVLTLGLRFVVYLALIVLSWVAVGELRRSDGQQLLRFLGRKAKL